MLRKRWEWVLGDARRKNASNKNVRRCVVGGYWHTCCSNLRYVFERLPVRRRLFGVGCDATISDVIFVNAERVGIASLYAAFLARNKWRANGDDFPCRMLARSTGQSGDTGHSGHRRVMQKSAHRRERRTSA